MKNIIRPFQYPLITGAIPAGVAQRTEVRTVTTTIPFNSKFVWTHTLNATIDGTANSGTVNLMLYDSKKGPISNVPTLVENISGTTYSIASVAPRIIRPFPLPEAYLFDKGSVLTAAYTITVGASNGGSPNYVSVGVILCGFRITTKDDS